MLVPAICCSKCSLFFSFLLRAGVLISLINSVVYKTQSIGVHFCHISEPKFFFYFGLHSDLIELSQHLSLIDSSAVLNKIRPKKTYCIRYNNMCRLLFRRLIFNWVSTFDKH